MPSESQFREGLHARLVSEALLAPDAVERTDLVFNLTRFYNRLGQDAESVQRRLGWTWAGFKVLNLLWAAGPMEARHLGRLTGSSRASISSLLATLERDGLIARDRSDNDRRQMVVRLTHGGEARLREGVSAQAVCDRAWFEILTIEEQRTLAGLLQRLASQHTPSHPD